MPISKERWSEGVKITPVEELIMTFLTINSTKAFSMSEIIEAINPKSSVPIKSAYFSYYLLILREMVQEGKVSQRLCKTEDGTSIFYTKT